MKSLLGAATMTLLTLPAHAQWHAAVGVGARQVTNTEYDKAAKQLVREAGWLPGAVLNAAYETGRYSWFAGAEIFNGGIDYHGQTQAGAAGLQEKTRTRRLIAGARRTWLPAATGEFAVDAAVILAEPERLQVGFSGLLDPVSLGDQEVARDPDRREHSSRCCSLAGTAQPLRLDQNPAQRRRTG